MRSLARVFRSFLVAAPLLGFGCGEPGMTDKDDAARTAQAPGAVSKGKGSDSQTTVTPDRAVDTKALVDVVKEEVKGGESSGGPTPQPYLWLPADLKLVKDEPLKIDPPLGLEPLGVNVPLTNPLTKAKVELGKQLYFDPRISKDGTVSCATCHNPATGWTDQRPGSVGIKGQVGSRNAPTVLNTVYGRVMFWDGRAPSLEGQAQGPVQNKIEMGDQTYKEIIERLRTIPGYVEGFKKVFGTDVTLDGMAKAIASFERTALSGNSAYDRYVRTEDPEVATKAMNESAKRGMVLFGLQQVRDDDPDKDKLLKAVTLKKAQCTSCHAGSNFTDDQYHNLGIGWDAKTGKFADHGRFVIAPIGSKNEKEIGAFKTPTLRDVTRTYPYMHDGSEDTLEKVIDLYDKGGVANPYLDPDMKPLKLTKQEKADLVEFMKALAGEEMKVAMPTLPTGPDGKSPDPVAALTPPQKGKSVSLEQEPHGVLVGP
jgi:cytochrome c peroxidase